MAEHIDKNKHLLRRYPVGYNERVEILTSLEGRRLIDLQYILRWLTF